MYSKPDYTSFTVDGMDIQIAVYSPSGKFTAESITSWNENNEWLPKKHF